ncbi:MAG: MBG domain-containing protein, partial [Acidobacteria bacterium]|nr:MBG domain-containing protein [Acidobacteriota bacterium]
YNLGDLTITNSTFTGNKAVGPTAEGGAIDSEAGTLTIINSTISGNSSDSDGGGILNCGSSTATLINVTITGNRADEDDAAPGGEGGGLAQVSSNPVTLINTIVAGNLRGTASPVADDIFVFSGPSTLDLAGSKNNLIGDAATSGGITHGGANNNVVGNSGAGTINIATVLRTTLANNGGPTQTHLLLPGSPAVNAGSNCVTLPAGCAPAPLTTDQRGTGFPRLINGTVDIGAVEVNYVIAPIAGAPQSAAIGTAFPVDSKVTVTESGVLKSGISVTFKAPGGGPSGTFPGGVLTATVNTDVNGVATSPTFTANNIIGGPYTITGTLTGSSQSTNIGELTNTKIPAQITLSNLVQTYDGLSKTVGVTTSPPGLPVIVTYNGSTNPPVNAGTYAVVATISHSDYAGQALATLTVNQVNNTITFGALANKTFGAPDFTVNATSSANLPVVFSTTGSCTVTGNTVHLTGAGVCTITASQANNPNYSSTPVSQTFSIAQASTTTTVTSSVNPSSPGQNVTFTATVASTAGTPTGSVQFVIDGIAVGATQALNGSGSATFSTSTLTVGTHTVSANYGGAGSFSTSAGSLSGGQQVNIQTRHTEDRECPCQRRQRD